MNSSKNPFRNFAFFVVAATLLVVLLMVGSYFAIGLIF